MEAEVVRLFLFSGQKNSTDQPGQDKIHTRLLPAMSFPSKAEMLNLKGFKCYPSAPHLESTLPKLIHQSIPEGPASPAVSLRNCHASQAWVEMRLMNLKCKKLKLFSG